MVNYPMNSNLRSRFTALTKSARRVGGGTKMCFNRRLAEQQEEVRVSWQEGHLGIEMQVLQSSFMYFVFFLSTRSNFCFSFRIMRLGLKVMLGRKDLFYLTSWQVALVFWFKMKEVRVFVFILYEERRLDLYQKEGGISMLSQTLLASLTVKWLHQKYFLFLNDAK